jgi:hypothetical protein
MPMRMKMVQTSESLGFWMKDMQRATPKKNSNPKIL